MTISATVIEKAGWARKQAAIQEFATGDARAALAKSLLPVAYWRLGEGSGASAADIARARNGAYTATDLADMLAQMANPFIGMAPLFEHANATTVDLFSAGLAAAVDMSEMSFALAIRAIDASVWTDATARYPLILRAGTTANQITVQRAVYDGQIFVRRYAGGIIKQTIIVNLADADWHIIGFSVSEDAGIQQTYLDGVPYGPAEVPGTWAGGALTMAQLSSATAGQRWEGGIAEVALFARALTDAEQILFAGDYYVAPAPSTDVIDLADPRAVLAASYSAALFTRLTEDSTTGATAYDWSGNARNGAYTATDLTTMLDQLDGPFGRRAALFTHANASVMNFFSAGLAAAIDMAEMSCFIALKVSAAGIWTDATSRYPLLMRAGTTQNQIFIQRTTIANQIIIRRTAGNVSKTTTLNNINPTGWFTIGFEVSEAGGFQNAYYNGIPEGAAITPDAWAGGALTLAQLSPAVGSKWDGGMADFAIFPSAIGAEAQARLAGDFFAGILEADPGAYEHILITGQSLTEGTGSGGALTLTQLYGGNYKMSSRPASTWLMPLREVYNTNYPNLESPGSAIGNAIRAASGQQMIVTRNGQDGQAYATLKKGSQPYADGITQVTNARTRVGSTNYHCAGVSVIHGETDGANGVTAAAYQGYLEEWQSDYQTDINAITGEAGVLPMLLCQMSAQAGTVTNVLKQVSLGQVAACKDNPTLLFMACPKYMFAYADTVHLTAASYRWLGEYHAKAWQAIIEGGAWTPLWPTAVSRVDAVITITMNVPVGPLVFDTTTVAAVPNYGFEYFDDGTPPAISSVAIDGNDIVVTLASTPTGANKKIRYAYTNQIGGVGPKGNLRDSDASTSIYGNTLYNWCVHFEEAVT